MVRHHAAGQQPHQHGFQSRFQHPLETGVAGIIANSQRSFSRLRQWKITPQGRRYPR